MRKFHKSSLSKNISYHYIFSYIISTTIIITSTISTIRIAFILYYNRTFPYLYKLIGIFFLITIFNYIRIMKTM